MSSAAGATSTAAVLHGREDLRLEVRTARELRPGELLIQVAAAGICGTDLREYAAGPILTPITHAHPITGHRGPMVLGHEFAGRVHDLMPDVSGFAIGDLVTCGAGVSCGVCTACRRGSTNLCETYWTAGLNADGGLAGFCAVPADVCVNLRDSRITPDAAALAQPLAIATHSVRRGAPAAGESVAIVGAGGIGAFMIAVLAAETPDLTVLEIDPHRRALASALAGDAAEVSPEAPRSRHYDLVFEVSGSSRGLRTALDMVRLGGRIVLVGLQADGAAPGWLLREVSQRELTLIGPQAHVFASDFRQAVAFLDSGRGAHAWPLIAPSVLPLSALPDVLTATGGRRPLKTLFDPFAQAERPARHGPGA